MFDRQEGIYLLQGVIHFSLVNKFDPITTRYLIDNLCDVYKSLINKSDVYTAKPLELKRQPPAKFDSSAVQFQFIFSNPVYPLGLNINRLQLFALLQAMLVTAWQNECSFAPVFYLLGTACTQHGFSLNEIVIPVPNKIGKFNLLDYALKIGDENAAAFLQKISKLQPTTIPAAASNSGMFSSSNSMQPQQMDKKSDVEIIRVKIEPLETMTLDQRKSLLLTMARTIRGTNNAPANCSYLAADLIEAIRTRILPVAPSITQDSIPCTARVKFFPSPAYIQGNPVGIVLHHDTSKANPMGEWFPPRVELMETEEGKPIEVCSLTDIPAQYSHFSTLETDLKNEASLNEGAVYGRYFIKLLKALHVGVFFATKEDVCFVDPGFLIYGAELAPVVFEKISASGYKFDHAAPNRGIKAFPNIHYIVEGPGPQQVNVLAEGPTKMSLGK